MSEPTSAGQEMTGPARFVIPQATSTSRPFWEATRERRYLVQWCTTCERPIHYPRAVCPTCLGDALEWRESTGRGVVHAVSVQHVKGAEPYAVALVDLEDGIRVMSNVVGCTPAEVRVGLRVALTWEALDDGRHLPLFVPTPAHDGAG